MSRDTQSIPSSIISRGHVLPLAFVHPDRKLDWTDLGDEAVAVTNMEMDVILFYDYGTRNIICLLKSSGTKLKRSKGDGTGLSREWMYPYSILYITENDLLQDVREQTSPYGLGRLAENASRNMNRLVNHGNPHDPLCAIATLFPPALGPDPPSPYLFQLNFGQMRHSVAK